MKHGSGKNGVRLIFDGSTQFDAYELGEIEKFKEFMQNQKKKELEFVDDSKILRYLQACAWKKDKTYQSLYDNIAFCKSLPVPMSPNIQKYLVIPLLNPLPSKN